MGIDVWQLTSFKYPDMKCLIQFRRVSSESERSLLTATRKVLSSASPSLRYTSTYSFHKMFFLSDIYRRYLSIFFPYGCNKPVTKVLKNLCHDSASLFVCFLYSGRKCCFQWAYGPAEARTGSARSSFGSCLSYSVSSPFMAGLRGPRWPIMCPRNHFDGRSSHLLHQNTSVVFALYLLSVTLLPYRTSLFSCSVIRMAVAELGACCSLQTARHSSLSA